MQVRCLSSWIFVAEGTMSREGTMISRTVKRERKHKNAIDTNKLDKDTEKVKETER